MPVLTVFQPHPQQVTPKPDFCSPEILFVAIPPPDCDGIDFLVLIHFPHPFCLELPRPIWLSDGDSLYMHYYRAGNPAWSSLPVTFLHAWDHRKHAWRGSWKRAPVHPVPWLRIRLPARATGKGTPVCVLRALVSGRSVYCFFPGGCQQPLIFFLEDREIAFHRLPFPSFPYISLICHFFKNLSG